MRTRRVKRCSRRRADADLQDIVDSAWDLPGPAAVALDGEMQTLP